MSEPKDGGPAFPGSTTNEWGYANNGGMSLRDYFAGQALIGLLSAAKSVNDRHDSWSMAKLAYQTADSMLEARKE